MQSLTRRLATVVRRPWPGAPVSIALVITELDVGGAERALVALATRLDRRHWRPTVISLGPEGPMAEPLREAGVETISLGLNPSRPWRAVSRLAVALRRCRPRLVQSFLFHANIATRLAAPRAGRPWVVGGIRVAERRPGKFWHMLLDRMTARLGTGSVCVSRGVLRFTRDAAGISETRLTVIPNGVDLAAIDRAEPLPRASIGVRDDALMALYVGRLDVQKGLPYLLDAAERIVAERPDWHLVLVGDGPERDWLKGRLSRTKAFEGRAHWLGQRDDVPALLKAADLLVLPSLFEGMPNVVLEAMAARRPVVATAVEGAEEIVVPGQTGWLVPPRDATALAEALLHASSDYLLRLQFGQAGRARVESHFTIDRAVAAYQRLWAGVLGFGEAATEVID